MDYRFWNRTTEGKWDWYPIRFLESNENLKKLLGENSQRTISTGLASDISVCLQQGRAFFELSALSPLEIRPLQLFYGMVGFAKAVAVARKLERLDTLDRVHGLSDVSDPKGHIENFKLEFNSRGTFQAMNDSIKELEKLHVHTGKEIKKLTRATCGSDDLKGKTITLKSILGRLPHLEDRYEETFREPASVIHCGHFEVAVYEGRNWLELSMHQYGLKQDREVFGKFIVELRRKFGFLNKWCFVKAEWYDGVVSILFASATDAVVGQSQEKLYETVRGFESDSVQVLYAKELTEKYIAEKTDPVSGNLVKGDTWVIEPYEGLTLSEMSLHYCAMFMIGSLVRYYPNIWTNVLSRRADDKALPLIESFINLTTIRFPAMVTNAIREPYGSQ